MTGGSRRVALIPGGGRGIGRAVGLSLAAGGWDVVIAYRSNPGPPEVESVPCDVSDPNAAAGLVREVEARHGRIDALINAAGPYHRVSLMEETEQGWHEMFDNNLHPVFYLSRAVFPGMKARGWGRIVNFGVANAGQMSGQPNVAAYYIAKVGVLILTRSLAKLYAPHGVTVNTVSPGFIDTGGAAGDELPKLSVPAGRLGTPEDVVGAVRFLLTDEAAYVNGADIQVSGGWGV